MVHLLQSGNPQTQHPPLSYQRELRKKNPAFSFLLPYFEGKTYTRENKIHRHSWAAAVPRGQGQDEAEDSAQRCSAAPFLPVPKATPGPSKDFSCFHHKNHRTDPQNTGKTRNAQSLCSASAGRGSSLHPSCS